MAISRGARSSEYRSKSVRSGEALGARLFRPGSSAQPVRNTGDTQASIRSALRRRRRTLGLTQEGAARVLGMPRLTYHRIETGARHIHFTELAKICALFNCHIGELVQDGQLATAFIHAAKAILGEAPE
ncbi:MAG: helix-turn-helix transcriptional regulator [Alphaproteobacteria bacterium]|nr:MAG: helix-turn-helix transcriptional regulator [Alphaproteobacteria bacterium]